MHNQIPTTPSHGLLCVELEELYTLLHVSRNSKFLLKTKAVQEMRVYDVYV